MKKYISFDIDGIINNYPKCFMDFFKYNSNLDVSDFNFLKKHHYRHYKSIKDLYRRSNFKYQVEVNPIVKDLINNLSLNYQIVILSTRPFESYENMYSRTFDWLLTSGIKFDFLDKKNILSFKKYSPIIHVDDDINHVSDLVRFFTSTQFVVKGINIDGVICFGEIADLPNIIKNVLANY